MTPAKLAAWVKAQRSACDSREVAIDGWSVRQLVNVANREEQAPIITLAGDLEPDELARAALAAARQDADDVGGPCKYALIALDSDERPIGRTVWRILGDVLSTEAEPAEAPTASGITSQLMRHHEARERIGATKERIQAESHGALISHYRQALEDARAEISTLRKAELDNMRLLSELVTAKAKNEIETARELHALQLKTRAWAKLETLVPVVANRLAGRPLLPEGKGGEAIEALLMGLEPEQLERIAEVLHPDQRAAFLEVWSDADKKRPPSLKANEEPAPVAAE